MAQVDYPAHLEMMWQKAIAPRADDAPTVISLFAGGGGSLTGYMMAGFRDLLAVEWDDNAVETLRLNWPELDIYHGDIANLTVEDVLQRTGLQPGELDILDGSPPCQGFSTAGKRILDAPRNQLFREYVRLLRGLKPKVFVMENVSGMVKGKMKLVFADILRELKASGYRVSARLLNVMYFHVPQSRQRMIFIGVRDDLGIEPSHPKAESREQNGNALLPDNFSHLRFLSWRNTGTDDLIPLGKSPRGITRKGVDLENRILLSDPGGVKIFQSFPSIYAFCGTKTDQLNRIGNSVPPLFMEAIARHIRTQILDNTARQPELVT